MIAVAGFLFWTMQQKHVVLDPAEVERIASRLLPGAAPPPGLKAVLALRPEEGLEVAIFAPSLDKVDVSRLEGKDLRIVIAHPDQPTGNPDLKALASKIGEAQGRKAEEMDTLEESPVMVEIGGRPYPAMSGRAALKASGKRVQEFVTILSPGSNTVVVLVTGPDGSFDRATMDRFLAGLQGSFGDGAPSLPGAGAPALPSDGDAQPPLPGPPPGGPPGPP